MGSCLKRRLGWFVLIVVAVSVSTIALGQGVLDSAMCLSLPPYQRVTEFQAGAGSAYVWALLSDVRGAHSVHWEWIAPSGELHRVDGPISINEGGGEYPVYPLTQSLELSDAAVRSRPGTWRVRVLVDSVELVTETFDVVSITSVGDYGDAPDGDLCGYASDPSLDVLGRFPTRFDTANSRIAGEPGAHVLACGDEALGDPRLTSLEKGATDTDDPDGTANLVDDDLDDGLAVSLLSDGSLGFSIRITSSAEAPERMRYLNAVYDINRDGEWRNTVAAAEWILVNRAIDLRPGETRQISVPLQVGTDWIASIGEPRWLRLVLSDAPISESRYAAIGGWDGSGQFARGEVEDHKIGVASAHDIAWASRHASRVSWAAAQAHAFSLAWSLSTAMAKATAVSAAYADALTYVSVAADAKAYAYAQATAAAAAHARAIAQADAFALASASAPCANVTAWASASVSAILEASAQADATAAAAAVAAAEAHAQALAYADALAVAMADAEATAVSFALSVADAYAEAEAYASSGARASAWADAWAQSTGSDALAVAHALAWAQARAWATTAVSVGVETSTWSLAVSYADAIAQAFTYAEVAVLALAQASASAEAWAVAAADANAIATASVDIIANAAAGASVTVIEDCCETLSPDCPACNSCCPPVPACDSCCPECPPCDSCCPECPDGGDTEDGFDDGFYDCRDQWPAIPDDIQDAIVRLAYVTGDDAAYYHEFHKTYRSKSDIKYDVDLWDEWDEGDRQIQRDARDIKFFLVPAMGDAVTQMVALWQMAYDLGYSGLCLPDCFSHLRIPDWQ